LDLSLSSARKEGGSGNAGQASVDVTLNGSRASQIEVAADHFVKNGIWISATVYTSEDDGTEIAQAIFQAGDLFDLELAYQARAERGSWFRRCWIRTKQIVAQEEVKNRGWKLESAIELEVLGKRRAEVDNGAADLRVFVAPGRHRTLSERRGVHLAYLGVSHRGDDCRAVGLPPH
jgi:hypothetical protein